MRASPSSLRLARWLALVFAVLLSVARPALAGPPPTAFVVAPVPGWVRAVALDLSAPTPAGEIRDGVHYLLAEQQTLIEAHDRVSYRRMVSKAVDRQGVDAVAQISIDVDPSYQTLLMHSLTVHRGGQALSKLAEVDVRVMQREKDAESRIFDGRQEVALIVNDLRVGDVVEYAFSLRGANEVFANRQFGRMDMQWGVPVAQVYRRLVTPVERPLTLRGFNGVADPRISEVGAEREYVWEAQRVAPVTPEGNVPGWYESAAYVEWSEYADWGAVARWALPLYRVPPVVPPALQAEVDRLMALPDARERLAEALRFVQREVRYLGVEVGPGSHAPNPPERVLLRRYGDCKDKTLLTVTLLRALGVDAHPALVDTSRRRGIVGSVPMPGAFDHVIVRARLDGKTYWIDPTRDPQPGSIDAVYQPDYGFALIVDEASTALEPMPVSPSQRRVRTMTMRFDATRGFDAPAGYVVQTRYEGITADQFRASLSKNSHAGLQHRYLNFYAESYPKLSVAAPMTVEDDAANNRITVTEHYTIEGLWQKDAKLGRRANFGAPDIESLLRAPTETIRRAPLAVPYPEDLRVSVEAQLPQAWTITPVSESVIDPAFKYESRVSGAPDGRTLRLDYHFVSTSDHVPAPEVARYAANLQRAWKDVGYSLSLGDEATPTVGPVAATPHTATITAFLSVAAGLTALTLAALGGAAWLSHRRGETADLGPAAAHRPGAAATARLLAGTIDALLLGGVSLALTMRYQGLDAALESSSQSLDAAHWYFDLGWACAITLIFWRAWQATPGKLLLGLHIVDERSGAPATWLQCIVRYCAYVLSALPLGLGYFWVLVDSRRRTWHDILSGTVVRRRAPHPFANLPVLTSELGMLVPHAAHATRPGTL